MKSDVLASILTDTALRPLLMSWARLQLAQDPQPRAFSQPGSPCQRLREGQERLCSRLVRHLHAHYRQATQGAKALATQATEAFYSLQNPYALRELSLEAALDATADGRFGPG